VKKYDFQIARYQWADLSERGKNENRPLLNDDL
jgi:hypothetical protein